jgi:hypothetical protein
MGRALLVTAKRAKGRSDIAMKVRDLVIQCDGFADQVDRYVIAARLMGDDSQEVQSIGVVWISPEDLPVKALGFGKPAGFVEDQRVVDGLVDIEHHEFNRISLIWAKI